MQIDFDVLSRGERASAPAIICPVSYVDPHFGFSKLAMLEMKTQNPPATSASKSPMIANNIPNTSCL